MKKDKKFPVFFQNGEAWSLDDLRKRNKKFISITILYLANPGEVQKRGFWDYIFCSRHRQEIKEVTINDENGILLSLNTTNKVVVRFRDEKAWEAVEDFDSRTMDKGMDQHLFYPYRFTFPVMNIKKIVWL